MITIELNRSGVRQGLADVGVTGCRLTRRSLQADVLELQVAAQSVASTALGWVYDAPISLWDGAEALFHGRVGVPEVSWEGGREGLSVRCENVWGELVLPFLQEVPVDDGTEWTGDVRIATNEQVEVVAISVAVDALIGYAQGRGVAVSMRGDLTGECPAVRGQNQSVGDLLRTVFRWAPERVVRAVYGGDGSTELVVSAVGEMPTRTLPVYWGAGLHLRPRYDLVPDGVHVIYAVGVQEYFRDDAGVLQERSVSAVERDWAGGGVISRRSLVVTLQGAAPSREPLPNAVGRPMSITNTSNPVSTRPLPRSGENGLACRKWWLDHSGLANLGLAVGDVLVAGADNAGLGVRMHRIALDAAPPEDPPSALTRGARPLYRPPSVDDLPRELVSGSITEWMRCRAARVVAEATLAVQVSAVKALPESARKAVVAMSTGKVVRLGSADAYLIPAMCTVMGTDARTHLYLSPESWDPGEAGASDEDVEGWNREALAAGLDVVRVPGLAQRLWDAVRVLHWEGSLSLSGAEVEGLSGVPEIGERVRFSCPEWVGTDRESASAMVREVSMDVAGGSVTVGFGPPDHLGPADWTELAAAARAHVDRERSAAAAQGGGMGWTGTSGDWRENGATAEGASYGPVSEYRSTGGGGELYTPGFWVSWAGDGQVRVQPSVVGGVMPDVEGTWSVGVGGVIALRVRMEPSVVDKDASGSHDWQIVDGGGSIKGAVTVEVYGGMSAANGASQIAVINNGTGAVVQDGIYVLPLAMVTGPGVLTQVGYIGPIGIRMCASGAAIVGSPAIQVVAVDDKGKIVAPSLG